MQRVARPATRGLWVRGWVAVVRKVRLYRGRSCLELDRLAHRLARCDFQFDASERLDAGADSCNQRALSRGLSRQSALQNVSRFLFHGAAVLSGPHPQSRFELIVQIPDGHASHERSSRMLIIDGILINDCNSGKPEITNVDWPRRGVTLRTVQSTKPCKNYGVAPVAIFRYDGTAVAEPSDAV